MPLRIGILPVALHFFVWFCAFTATAGVAETGGAGIIRPLTPESWSRLVPHPRLFLTDKDLEVLRARLDSDRNARRLSSVIRAEAERLLSQPVMTFAFNGKMMLSSARGALGRIFHLAFVARLTGDQRFVDRAKQELLNTSALVTWNPNTFLDTAELTLAAAVGYDWLYPWLTPDERAGVAHSILRKGLQPSFPEQVAPGSWITGTFNWNQVCHASLVAGALVIGDLHPEIAQRTVRRALDNIHFAAHEYAPDGAYPEGTNYWAYGTTFQVILATALRSALGDTHGVDEFPGFRESLVFAEQMTGPTGLFFNWADGREFRSHNPVVFYLAPTLGLSSVSAREWDIFHDWLAQRSVAEDPTRFLTLGLIWWCSFPPAPARSTEPLARHYSARGLMPVGAHRSAWDDPRAAYLAIKGGRSANSHAHMDVGTFVVEADGVRWTVDPDLQSYAIAEAAGLKLWTYTDEGDRWNVFRLGPDSHNILRFNGGHQNTTGDVPILRSSGEGPAGETVLDLTPAYSAWVTHAQRRVALRTDGRFEFEDTWTAKPDAPLDVVWQWLTRANVEVRGRTVTLHQGKASLTLEIVAPPEVTITVDDVSQPRARYDAPNPGVKRINVRLSAPANAPAAIRVVATPGSLSARSESGQR